MGGLPHAGSERPQPGGMGFYLGLRRPDWPWFRACPLGLTSCC